MEDNLFKWSFKKNQDNFIYDTLKELAESLKKESDEIFEPHVTIADIADNSRTYTFIVRIPELSGFSLRIFEINTKNSTRNSEIVFHSSTKGDLSFKIGSKDNLVETINRIINEKEVVDEMSTFINKVIIKRKQQQDFKSN